MRFNAFEYALASNHWLQRALAGRIAEVTDCQALQLAMCLFVLLLQLRADRDAWAARFNRSAEMTGCAARAHTSADLDARGGWSRISLCDACARELYACGCCPTGCVAGCSEGTLS